MTPHSRAFIATLLLTVSHAAAQWTVVDLHPAGSTDSASDGGGSGQQVGYVRVGPTVGHTRASLWNGSGGAWINLQPPTALYSQAFASDGVQQVGECFIGSNTRAAVWGGSAGTWADLQPPGAFTSSALDVDAGLQVGWVSFGYNTAAAWTGSSGSWVSLAPTTPSGTPLTSEAYGVRAGRIVGHVVTTDSVISAALWPTPSSGWINLHPPGNISSWAYAVDGATQVGAVRVPDTSSHAAMWTGSAASWVDLHPTASGAVNSRASDVKDGMQVGYAVFAGMRHAALWKGSAASWVDLHAFLPAGFIISEATAIVIDGGTTTITGSAYSNRTGHNHAVMWVASCPCPADFNGSGGTPDGADIADFFASWLIGDPSADADCSGGTPDAADITVFFLAWLAGSC
jgi:hypothetical protein